MKIADAYTGTISNHSTQKDRSLEDVCCDKPHLVLEVPVSARKREPAESRSSNQKF